METKQYIRLLANFLATNGMKMTAKQLVIHLNFNGFKTQSGEPYKTIAQGPYSLIRSVYEWLHNNNFQDEADNVATVFTKDDGTYAYE